MSDLLTAYRNLFIPKVETTGTCSRVQPNGAYTYIPLDESHFSQSIRLAKRVLEKGKSSSPHSFIDVGCGIGEKVILAGQAFLQENCYGLEINAAYGKAARKLLNASFWNWETNPKTPKWLSQHIIVGDGRTFDFSPFSCIYAYRPMVEQENQDALLLQILTTMKVGSVLSLHDSGLFPIDWPKLGFLPLPEGIYYKVKSRSITLGDLQRPVHPSAE